MVGVGGGAGNVRRDAAIGNVAADRQADDTELRRAGQ